MHRPELDRTWRQSVAAFGILALVMVPALAAQAQEAAATPSPTPAATQEDQPAPDSTTEKPAFAETITVTANKREEDVRKVAASVSVVDEDQLSSLGAKQLTDFADYVPGLNVTSSGTPGQTTITLRGIAPISSGATVATYVGEAPLGSSGIYQRATIFALDLLPDDVERVEVLRGPQGTLYGAGAMGGLLKYVPRDPDLATRHFHVSGALSDIESGDNGGTFAVSANLPAAGNSFGVRASYARNELPGYVDNSVDGRKNINEGTQESGRVAMLWQASDSVRFKLDLMRQQIDSDNNALVALDPGTLRPLHGDLVNEVSVDEPFKKDLDLYMATLDWNVGWGTLTSASAYSDATTDQRQDATVLVGSIPLAIGLPPGLAYFDLSLGLSKFTQELRLTSNAKGRYDWQLGGFYSHEHANNRQVIRVTDTSGNSVPVVDPLADLALPSNYEETAAFGNGTYRFSERFELDMGARLSRNKQDFAQVVDAGVLLGLALGTTPGGSDETVFTWSLGPRFHLTPDAMVYARIATGYQPGGPNVALPGVPPSVDASRLTSYEVGLKSETSDHRWLFDLSGYDIQWSDVQVIAAAGATTFAVNGGKASSQGVELSTAWRPTDNLRIGLNGAYTDATLSNDVASPPGEDGDHLPYIPKLSYSVMADYYFPLGSSWSTHFGGGYRWIDDRKSSFDSDPTALTLDSYGACDLSADVFNERWTVRLFARNVTDKRAYQTMTAVDNLILRQPHHVSASPIDPRTLGIQLGLSF